MQCLAGRSLAPGGHPWPGPIGGGRTPNNALWSPVCVYRRSTQIAPRPCHCHPKPRPPRRHWLQPGSAQGASPPRKDPEPTSRWRRRGHRRKRSRKGKG
eukprot:4758949-Lingulodinium_polyedra.AAC.1